MAITVLARLLAAGLCLLAPHAHAQTVQPSTAASSGVGALRRVGAMCKAETQRLCPALAGTTAGPRDQLICLRPYRTSLSFNCRSAINALNAR